MSTRSEGARAKSHASTCGHAHGDEAEAEEPERWPVERLIRHLIDEFHTPARHDAPRLLAAMDVALFTMEGRSPLLEELAQLVAEIVRDLLDHMEKEENVLFPWILSGRGQSAYAPIRAMTYEHKDSVVQLDRLRELRELLLRLDPPDEVLSFLERLEAFEHDLREHTRIENDVLFLRTLQGW